MDESWHKVYGAETAHEKAKVFQDIIVEKLNEIFPEKVKKVNSDDQPWLNFKKKKIDRKKKRIYHKERMSKNWKKMDKLYRKEIKSAKAFFYKQSVAELKQKNPSEWFKCLKRLPLQINIEMNSQ